MGQSSQRLFTILVKKGQEMQSKLLLTIFGNSVLSWYSLIASESSTIAPIIRRVIRGKF